MKLLRTVRSAHCRRMISPSPAIGSQPFLTVSSRYLRSLPDNITEASPVCWLHGIPSLQQTALHLLQPLRRFLYVRRCRGGPQALGDRASSWP